MSYIIYKICCDDLPEFIYIGSTKSFRHRKYQHKNCCFNENNNSYNNKIYTNIRENGGWDNWRMVIVEDIGEVSLTQARIKEEEHRVKLNANLNSKKCHQTQEEFKEYQKEYNKEYQKEYYINNTERKNEYYKDNKEKIKECKSIQVVCECGRTIRIGDKSRHEKTKIHKKYTEN